jgi:hypothetical protein
MNRTLGALALLVLAPLAGCSAAPAPASAPPTVDVTVPVPEPMPTTRSTPAVEPVATSWGMPDLVGMNLQEAQDALQRLTAFGVTLSTSSDARGEGRSQVLDRNWKVCDQDPPAGSTITSATVPDFSVVRTSESC